MEYKGANSSSYYIIEKIISNHMKYNISDKDFPLIEPDECTNGIELSIVIPAFNEEKRLSKTVHKIIKYFEFSYKQAEQKINYEIILVDGGSDDDTWNLIEQILNLNINISIIGIKIRNNLGKGHCVINGVKYSQGKYILVIDADGAGDIKEYKYFREEFDKLKYNLPYNDNLYDEHDIQKYKPKPGIIIASRFQKNRAWYRRYLSLINNIIINCLFNFDKINDSQCGFKLFTRESAKKIFLSLHLMKWAYDVEILILANQLGIKVKSKKMMWKEKEGSKLNIITALFLFLRDYIYLIYLYRSWESKEDKSNHKEDGDDKKNLIL